jgi:hypothetical protein
MIYFCPNQISVRFVGQYAPLDDLHAARAKLREVQSHLRRANIDGLVTYLIDLAVLEIEAPTAESRGGSTSKAAERRVQPLTGQGRPRPRRTGA